MAKYTYDNVLINPSKEGIESLIGKEVYFHNNPCLCLDAANENSTVNLGILEEIDKDSINPFVIKKGSAFLVYSCIIKKKEEPKPKPKYVPFKSNEEFLESYIYHKETFTRSVLAGQLYSLGGIWLKYKGIEDFFMITEFWDDMNRWGEFLERFTFLDGSPCGKLAEENKNDNIID